MLLRCSNSHSQSVKLGSTLLEGNLTYLLRLKKAIYCNPAILLLRVFPNGVYIWTNKYTFAMARNQIIRKKTETVSSIDKGIMIIYLWILHNILEQIYILIYISKIYRVRKARCWVVWSYFYENKAYTVIVVYASNISCHKKLSTKITSGD